MIALLKQLFGPGFARCRRNKPRRAWWICEYQAVDFPGYKGSLAVEAKHPIAARHFAKRKLRELFIKPSGFAVIVREPNWRERLILRNVREWTLL